MILDSFLLFDTSANLAQVAGTYNSANTIDLSALGLPPSAAGGGGARDMGIGDDPALKLMVLVTTAFLGGTSLQINFQGAPDAGNNTPGTWTTFAQSQATLTAQLIAGARLFDIDVPRPPAGVAPPRYYRLQYVILGNMTQGTIESGIVLDRFDQVESTAGNLSGYPAGITVSN